MKHWTIKNLAAAADNTANWSGTRGSYYNALYYDADDYVVYVKTEDENHWTRWNSPHIYRVHGSRRRMSADSIRERVDEAMARIMSAMAYMAETDQSALDELRYLEGQYDPDEGRRMLEGGLKNG